jgi:hypothetical protein
MKKESKFYGVTWDPRTSKYKSQVTIAGKPRFFGYHADKLEAAKVSENARVHLQEFFPKPVPSPRFEIDSPLPSVDRVRKQLIEENAQTFCHDPEATANEAIERAVKSVMEAQQRLNRSLRALNAALTKTK